MYLCQWLDRTVHPKNDILCVTDTIQDMTKELHMWQCSGFTAAGGPQQFHKATDFTSLQVQVPMWDHQPSANTKVLVVHSANTKVLLVHTVLTKPQL